MAMSDPTFGTTDIDMEMPKRTPSLMEQIGSVVATTVPRDVIDLTGVAL